MARVGQFSGQTFQWHAPLSVIHPPDNQIRGYQYHESLRAKMHLYTDAQLRDLEAEIRELEAVLRIDADWEKWR